MNAGIVKRVGLPLQEMDARRLPRRHSQRGRVPGRRLHARPSARKKRNRIWNFMADFDSGLGNKGCFQAFSPSENVPSPSARNAENPLFLGQICVDSSR